MLVFLKLVVIIMFLVNMKKQLMLTKMKFPKSHRHPKLILILDLLMEKSENLTRK